ncbi:hypothetical protein HY642_04765 [Candidatus Woesearchaeota archaeon]|nr:hypothetical protein [Candidatus Woesearchaeota archaeon]
MYVFGVDVPLVEMFFVTTLFFLVVAILTIYSVYKIIRISHLLDKVVKDETEELAALRDLQHEVDVTTTAMVKMTEKIDEALHEQNEELELLKELRDEMATLHGKPVVRTRIKREIDHPHAAEGMTDEIRAMLAELSKRRIARKK